MCEEEVQLSRPRPKSEIAQWNRKERWWYCLFHHWDAQAQNAAVFGDLADSFIRSLLQAGRAFQRIDIDRYYETLIMVDHEPEKDEQRFPASQKND